MVMVLHQIVLRGRSLPGLNFAWVETQSKALTFVLKYSFVHRLVFNVQTPNNIQITGEALRYRVLGVCEVKPIHVS